jgi:hypothetical protein
VAASQFSHTLFMALLQLRAGLSEAFALASHATQVSSVW